MSEQQKNHRFPRLPLAAVLRLLEHLLENEQALRVMRVVTTRHVFLACELVIVALLIVFAWMHSPLLCGGAALLLINYLWLFYRGGPPHLGPDDRDGSDDEDGGGPPDEGPTPTGDSVEVWLRRRVRRASSATFEGRPVR